MRLRLAVPFLALTIAACSDSTAPRAGVVGRWSASLASLGGSPASSWTLAFGADGRYVSEIRNRGVSPANVRAEGTYRIAGDTLYVRVSRVSTWDAFYGPTTKLSAQTFDPPAEPPPMRFAIAGNGLTLIYFTYPADAPVETTMTFQRTDCVLQPPIGALPAGCY